MVQKRNRLMKQLWFAQPHDNDIQWQHRLDLTNGEYTMIPMVHYDEGLGAPNTLYTNPKHASFAESNESNVCVSSHVDSFNAMLEVGVKSTFYDDNLSRIKFCYMVLASGFKEDLDVTDEVSGASIKSTLELQYETTDRQVYPLYNTQKLDEAFSGSATLSANEPGLTTTQVLEGIAFDPDLYYDTTLYTPIGKLLQSKNRGLKWVTLTRQHPYARIPIFLDSAAVEMNEYAHQHLLVGVPKAATKYQPITNSEITASSPYIHCRLRYRYNDWNQEYNFNEV